MRDLEIEVERRVKRKVLIQVIPIHERKEPDEFPHILVVHARSEPAIVVMVVQGGESNLSEIVMARLSPESCPNFLDRREQQPDGNCGDASQDNYLGPDEATAKG